MQPVMHRIQHVFLFVLVFLITILYSKFILSTYDLRLSLMQLLLNQHSMMTMNPSSLWHLYQVCYRFLLPQQFSIFWGSVIQYNSSFFLSFLVERDERLGSYALIARAAPGITIPFLSRLFSERFSLLNQVSIYLFPVNSVR